MLDSPVPGQRDPGGLVPQLHHKGHGSGAARGAGTKQPPATPHPGGAFSRCSWLARKIQYAIRFTPEPQRSNWRVQCQGSVSILFKLPQREARWHQSTRAPLGPSGWRHRLGACGGATRSSPCGRGPWRCCVISRRTPAVWCPRPRCSSTCGRARMSPIACCGCVCGEIRIALGDEVTAPRYLDSIGFFIFPVPEDLS